MDKICLLLFLKLNTTSSLNYHKQDMSFIQPLVQQILECLLCVRPKVNETQFQLSSKFKNLKI